MRSQIYPATLKLGDLFCIYSPWSADSAGHSSNAPRSPDVSWAPTRKVPELTARAGSAVVLPASAEAHGPVGFLGRPVEWALNGFHSDATHLILWCKLEPAWNPWNGFKWGQSKYNSCKLSNARGLCMQGRGADPPMTLAILAYSIWKDIPTGHMTAVRMTRRFSISCKHLLTCIAPETKGEPPVAGLHSVDKGSASATSLNWKHVFAICKESQ